MSAVHYFSVSFSGSKNSGVIIKRFNLRRDDAPLSTTDARCYAIDVAQEAANYANVPMHWHIEDIADGWLVTTTQFAETIGERVVRYLGTSLPETPQQPTYTEHSRHVSNGEAHRVVKSLNQEGKLAHVSFDSYSPKPNRVMVAV